MKQKVSDKIAGRQAVAVSWTRRHRALILISVGLLVVILFYFGAQLALYLNFLLGNDTIVSLRVDQSDLTLERGSSASLIATASVTANPFCVAQCQFEYTDVSAGVPISSEVIEIHPGISFSKTLSVTATRKGAGQDLYRVSIDCHGLQTWICNTDESEHSTRSILVTVERTLNAVDSAQKERGREVLVAGGIRLVEAYHEYARLQAVNLLLAQNSVVEPPNRELSAIREDLVSAAVLYNSSRSQWYDQNFALLADQVNTFEKDLGAVESTLSAQNQSIRSRVAQFNQLLADFNATRDGLVWRESVGVLSSNLTKELNNSIVQLTKIVPALVANTSLASKLSKFDPIQTSARDLIARIDGAVQAQAVGQLVVNDVLSQARCTLTGVCELVGLPTERANLVVADTLLACNTTGALRQSMLTQGSEAQVNYDLEGYPTDSSFSENMTQNVRAALHDLATAYLVDIPKSSVNRKLITNALAVFGADQSIDYSNSSLNLSRAYAIALEQFAPLPCQASSFTFVNAPHLPLNPLQLDEIDDGVLVSSGLSFVQPPLLAEPDAVCCVFGECEDCCTDAKCASDESTYPILFLHGHSVNQDVSAEYSLEGFNQIQARLEEDGFVNAGTVTLYTSQNGSRGLWGRMPAPVTMRGSYYFDIFRQPDDYVVVQTKSENIDTYSIRLRELVDIVKFKTGKPKVNIVAFSMGGLVSRRYIQIFGEDSVNKLILIAVPNKGVVGDVADYCPWVGSELECRDLNADSLFINKLNTGKNPSIPVYNIVGTGCDMTGGTGDGAVLEDHARLDWATNYLIKGSCRTSVKPLHLEIRDITRYPKVYEYIRLALLDTDSSKK